MAGHSASPAIPHEALRSAPPSGLGPSADTRRVVARTVVDLARTSSFRAGVVVADSALRGKQVSKDELRAVVADCARWPGIRQANMVVEFSDGRSESTLESISRSPPSRPDFPPSALIVSTLHSLGDHKTAQIGSGNDWNE
jgi:hypothetical protein